MPPLREVLARFGFEVDQKALAQGDAAVNKLNDSIGAVKKAFVALAPVVAANRLLGFVSDTVASTDALAKFSDALGFDTQRVAEWDYALQNAGVGLEQGRMGLRTFAKQLGEARGGNQDLAKSLRQLGVASRDSSGQLRSTEDVLDDAVLGLANVKDEARRAAIAEKLFGEAGLGFVRVARDGADALRAQRREMAAAYGGDFDAFVKGSRQAAVAMDGWRNATTVLKNVVANALIPAFTFLVRGVTKLAVGFTKLTQGTHFVRNALITVGAVAGAVAVKMLIAFAPVILTFVAIAAAIGIVVLIVDDMVALFTGGDSVLGRLLDKFFGLGTQEKVVTAVKDAFAALGSVIKSVGKVWDAVVGAWEYAVEKVALALEKVHNAAKKVGGFLNRAAEFVGPGGGVVRGARLAREDAAAREERRREDRARGVVYSPDAGPLEVIQARAAAVQRRVDFSLSRQGPSAASVGPSVSVQTNAQINVTSTSADPRAVAREVEVALDRREQESYRRARDRLNGR